MNDFPPAAPASRPARRWILPAAIVAIVALAGIGAWWLWGNSDTPSKSASADGQGAKGGKGGAGKGRGGDTSRLSPVTAVAARVGDINIVQTGLGTAIATRTAAVRPGVDGLLVGVNFSDGRR